MTDLSPMLAEVRRIAEHVAWKHAQPEKVPITSDIGDRIIAIDSN